VLLTVFLPLFLVGQAECLDTIQQLSRAQQALEERGFTVAPVDLPEPGLVLFPSESKVGRGISALYRRFGSRVYYSPQRLRTFKAVALVEGSDLFLPEQFPWRGELRAFAHEIRHLYYWSQIETGLLKDYHGSVRLPLGVRADSPYADQIRLDELATYSHQLRSFIGPLKKRGELTREEQKNLHETALHLNEILLGLTDSLEFVRPRVINGEFSLKIIPSFRGAHEALITALRAGVPRVRDIQMSFWFHNAPTESSAITEAFVRRIDGVLVSLQDLFTRLDLIFAHQYDSDALLEALESLPRFRLSEQENQHYRRFLRARTW
jgi:hypothetical protein